jgi:hypothetical protein
MSRICPVYASYLKRYGTSMKHLRSNSETSISLDLPVLLIAIHLAFSRLRWFPFESMHLCWSRLALKSDNDRNTASLSCRSAMAEESGNLSSDYANG